jgi:hypothetical protein
MIMLRVVVVVRTAFRGVRMAAAGIGAAFGIERRFDLDHAGAEPFDHRLDDVIAPDTQALGRDLRRQMTVAEMPGDPNQMVRVGTPDFGQRLRRRDHLLSSRTSASPPRSTVALSRSSRNSSPCVPVIAIRRR